ncbi:MAG: Phenylalanyl-tRNA synthetase beta subunit, partial [uncultured bacterium]
MNLALPTDAAIRFEKKIDPSLAEKSMVRVIEILEHISEGELEGICDQYPKKAKPWSVKLDLDYVGKLLGEDISAKRSKEILSLLGMKVNPVKSG